MADESLMDDSISTISVPTGTLDVQLKELKTQRSSRRGQITRVLNRLTALQKKAPSTVTSSVVELLKSDAQTAIQRHDDIQDQIDSLALDPSTFTDPSDRDRHEIIHANLMADIEALEISTSFHRNARRLMSDIRNLISLGADISTYKEDCDRIATCHSELHTDALALPDDDEAESLLTKVDALF